MQEYEPIERNEFNSEMEELSFIDKMVGVVTEPKETFRKISFFPPRVTDWLVPLIIALVVVALSTGVRMLNPDVAYKVKEDARKAAYEQLEKSGLSKSEIESRKEIINSQIDMMTGTMGVVFSAIGILVFGFVFFLLIAGIMFLIAKFVFKDNGSFSHALVANGLPAYITVIMMLLITVFVMATGNSIQDTSLLSLLNIDASSNKILYLLSFLDPFRLWAAYIVGLGMAQLFNPQNETKYIALSFGVTVAFMAIGVVFQMMK